MAALGLSLRAGRECGAQGIQPAISRNGDARPFLDLSSGVGPGVQIKGARATAWNEGQTRMLLLDKGAAIELPGYGITADRAVVRIETGLGDGGARRHISMFLDQARTVSRRGVVRSDWPRLLVTVRVSGEIALSTDLLRRTAAEDDALVAEARTAMELDDRERAGGTAGSLPGSGVKPVEGAVAAEEPGGEPEGGRSGDSHEQGRAEGDVSFYADKVVWRKTGDQSGMVVLTGGSSVQYQDRATGRVVTLTAGQAVVFLRRGVAEGEVGQSVGVDQVEGVYLEGGVVISDGQYTVRAPRVYYDLATDRAVLLEAVFYTWSVKRQVPIYVRAAVLRQESRRRWEAQDAVLTTSEFARPHLAIGANELALERVGGEDGQSTPEHYFWAKGVTMRWNDVPVFFWPEVAGRADVGQGVPLRRLDGHWTRRDGPVIESSWNLFSLLGRQEPKGVSLAGDVDFLGDHGPGVGVGLDYDLPRMFGDAKAYLIADDEGDDEIGDRDAKGFDGDARGFALWRHRQLHGGGWDLSLELGYVSDETLLEVLSPEEAELSKPYETSLYLKKQEQDWALDFLVQQDLMDFTAQTTQLQAPTRYTVEKQPELGYYRVGTSLLGNRLTYFSQTRLGRARIRVGKDRPGDRGFTERQSMLLFDQAATLEFKDRAEAEGVPMDHRLRADSRHELQLPTEMGPFNVVPFVGGRATAYNDDFAEFSGEDDDVRLRGQGGLRVHTQISRAYDDFESTTWDVHRLRHVVEPSVEAVWAGSTIDPDDLPVYDRDVEAAAEGWSLRMGLRNLLQTQRGGIGRWRSVDWFTWDSSAVFRGDDADVQTPIGEFFGYRPEYSVGGDHLENEWTWRVSETLAVVGQWTFDLERDRTAQWRVGASLQHSPDLRSFADYAMIEPLGSRLFGYGFSYQLTTKYDLSLTHTVDVSANQTRDIEVKLERRLPRWRLEFTAKFDGLYDETTFGLILIPEGLTENEGRGPGEGVRGGG